MVFSSMFSGGNNRKNGGGAAIGMVAIGLYWVLTLFTLQLSRTREYYADSHSASIVQDGARKLSEGLARIVNSTQRRRQPQMRQGGKSLNSFKALFISDPDTAATDSQQISQLNDRDLVEQLSQRRITTMDRIQEALSTHPNIVKRLKALKEIEQETAA